MNRIVSDMKQDGIEPKKLETTCKWIFRYLEAEKFNLKEIIALNKIISHILGKVEESGRLENQLKEIGEYDYTSCIDNALSSVAASNTES